LHSFRFELKKKYFVDKKNEGIVFKKKILRDRKNTKPKKNKNE